MFDIEKYFNTSESDKVQSKKCQNCIACLESAYNEMQRKHVPRVYEYQSSKSSHPVDD